MKHTLSTLFFLLISISTIYGQEQVKYQVAQYPNGKEELTKRKYMEQLRNIYLEFAKKFKECFILIY